MGPVFSPYAVFSLRITSFRIRRGKSCNKLDSPILRHRPIQSELHCNRNSQLQITSGIITGPAFLYILLLTNRSQSLYIRVIINKKGKVYGEIINTDYRCGNYRLLLN